MILLDTSFIVSYYNTRDQNHEEAKVLMKKIEEDSKCITDYVFDECMTVILARLKDLSQAVKIGEDMMRSFEIIYTDEDLFGAAWRVFKAQEGKLSFTDCSIIAAMKGKGIGSIATFDKDLLSAV